MRTRTSPQQLGQSGTAALRAALIALGLRAEAESTDSPAPHDLVVTLPGGETLLVEVKAAAIPTDAQVRHLAGQPTPGIVPVVVGDQISAGTRTALNDAGIGWLDRRGHLRLAAGGLFVDTDVPPRPRGTATTRTDRPPIAGRSGLAAAAALLLHPETPIGVTEIARVADLNPSSITRAMASIADADLAQRVARGRYRPLVPELFWALADVWPRERTAVRWTTTPAPATDSLAHAAFDPGNGTWVAGGVRGALAWGASLVATADYPIDLYVPDEQTVRRVVARHQGGQGPEVHLAVDPNGFVTKDPHQSPSFAWPVAHPLFCALDLTATSRDREALQQWTPPEGFARVW